MCCHITCCPTCAAMLELQDEFRVAWQQNASSPAAGAMFWGATAGPHINWNGFELRLDGGPSGARDNSRWDILLLVEGLPELSDVCVVCQTCACSASPSRPS